MASAYYEIYRGSPGVLDGKQSMIILQTFDRALGDATIATKVKAKATVKAHLRSYRHCEEVWTFSLQNAAFKMDNNQTVTTPRIKIIACKDGDALDSAAGTPQTSPAKAVRSSPVKRRG
ncbi:transcription initiation factor IIA, gamma subunit-domain-containing protein [Mycena polygramma]|nr:transcription initiation factor IIA, gamma subunit-domain-containing protein [Mycena polygramma]KAJ7642358.1 transcription initiation factor IIA, gamma subunit-domain-containing protein [Mycena polygramma]